MCFQPGMDGPNQANARLKPYPHRHLIRGDCGRGFVGTDLSVQGRPLNVSGLHGQNRAYIVIEHAVIVAEILSVRIHPCITLVAGYRTPTLGRGALG